MIGDPSGIKKMRPWRKSYMSFIQTRHLDNFRPRPHCGPLGFKPDELVESVSDELGVRSYLEKFSHELIGVERDADIGERQCKAGDRRCA